MKMNSKFLGEDLVISGISGRFPESDNVDEFMNNLLANKDLVTHDDRRWPNGYQGLPSGIGKIKDLTRLDADFFGINESEVHLMDAQIRIMLETTYEAIWDAGINPNIISGTKTGVYIGKCIDETQMVQADNLTRFEAFRQTFVGTVCQAFNTTGPALAVDTACASSFTALHEAVNGIRSGLCDRAFVIGVCFSLKPATHTQFARLNMTSMDGRCKCLDAKANGYAKGEACAAVFLQRKSEAKRIYGTIVHVKTNTDGYKEYGLTFPDSVAQKELMCETYAEAGVDPLDVKYVEAHCTGTPAGDPVEMTAIVEAMCSGRTEPLLIGAVKSNIGHAESASGLCSLIKLLLSFENQCIPANINYETPNPRIEGLMTGILKPILQNTRFDGRLAALNCFGFGGVNCHVIIRSDSKDLQTTNTDIFNGIPRLVLMCGRTEEGLNFTMSQILKTPKMLTRDYLFILNEVSKISPFKEASNSFRGMPYRGFAVINNENTATGHIFLSKVPTDRRQVWYLFSGLGSQWSGMVESLMNLNAFCQSIKMSAQVLKEYDLDLISVMNKPNEKLIDCPLNTMVSLTAFQIALVDILQDLNIQADGFIGYSIGELGCAYADGCVTHEEVIRLAYLGGLYLNERLMCKNANGIMETDSYNKINTDLDQIHNCQPFYVDADDSSVIRNDVAIDGIRKSLVKHLSNIIKSKRKMAKWLSTTFDLSDQRSQHLTSDYLIDNLIEPGHFSQALSRIPNNAIVLEVSPNMLFESIIKNSLGSDVIYIPLMKKSSNNIRFLLESIGKLYTNGINPSIENLYPKVELPVSRGTPSISPLINWDHNKVYAVFEFPDFFNTSASSTLSVTVDLQTEEDSYLMDHCIDGRIVFPATGYLLLAWKRLALMEGIPYEHLPVEFEDLRFHQATVLQKGGQIKFDIKVIEKSGQFVIIQSGIVCVTGRIFVPQLRCMRYDYLLNERTLLEDKKELILKNEDFYKMMRLRGYDYGPNFKCLTEASVKSHRVEALLKWNGHWTAFADCVLQIIALTKNSQNLDLPVRIESVRFDPKAMANYLKSSSDIPVVFDGHLGTYSTIGMEVREMVTNVAPRKILSPMPILGHFLYDAYEGDSQIESSDTHKLNEYIKQCNGLAFELAEEFIFSLKAFKTYDNNIIKNLSEKETNYASNVAESDDNNWLLKTLIAFKKDQNNINLNENLFNLDKDILNQYFRREYFLRPQIEIVVENAYYFNKSIDVLEVSQNSAIIAQSVIKMIGLSQYEVKTNYSLLHPMTDQLTNESVNNVKCHNWEAHKSQIPSELSNFDLIVFEDRISFISTESEVNLRTLFESLWNAVKNNGFLIVIHKNHFSFAEEVLTKILSDSQNQKRISNEDLAQRKNQIISEANRVGLTLITSRFDGISKSALIFRKLNADITVEKQTFIAITNDKCEQWIEKLQDSLKTIEGRPETENIWLVANDCPTNGIIGLVNCLRKEPNGHRIRCIFQNGLKKNEVKENAFLDILQNKDLLAKIVKKNLFMNVFNANNIWGAFRHFSIDENKNYVKSKHCYLNVQTRGDLSSFKWFEAQHKYWPLGMKEGQQLIDVYYSALNFKDVMYASGKLGLPADVGFNDCVLGFEYAGIDENGQRVFGMTTSKGLATSLVAEKSDFVWRVPDHWSMEEAVTVPVVYSTAYLALIIRGKLKPKESVLIHSGSGGVGLAAIRICLSMDCQLFITCGSEAKREFLKKEFSPKLLDTNFWTSRDSSFESFIMGATNGRGVDVVLNSLSDKKLQASVRCLATNGRFLEIGKYDMMQNSLLESINLLRNKTFHGIHLDLLMISDNSKSIQSQKQRISSFIANGIEEGTIRPIKPTVFDSSQVEQAFRFMASGKHMGKVVLKICDENSNKMGITFTSVPRTVFKPNLCYIITGGLGGFGLELADWMIKRGAVNLILTSRTGIRTPFQKLRINHFEGMGINVKISTKDVTNLSETRDLIDLATHMGSSTGVGGVFHLAMVLSDGLFENQTAQRFETVLSPKALAVKNLDIITRELCPLLEYFVCFSSGCVGLGNAGQTNYGFANSCMERVCDQRRLLNLPAQSIEWGAVGDVGVVSETMGNDVVVAGTYPQRIISCLAALDILLQTDHSVVSSSVRADLKSEKQSTQGNIVEKIENILGVKNYSDLDPKTPLLELGIDSIMSVEIKLMIERDYDMVLSVDEIRTLTVAQVKAIDQNNYKKDRNAEESTKKNSFDHFLLEIPEKSFELLNDMTEGKPLLLLPPIEGSFKLLTHLSQLIERPVIGLNWTEECQHLKTTEDLVDYYLNVIEKKIMSSFGDNFDLMGYSFGAIIAYEIAFKLQKNNSDVKPKLVLLDNSPVIVQKYMQIIRTNDRYMKNDVLSNRLIVFLNQFVLVEFKTIEKKLENIPSDQRLQTILKIFLETENIKIKSQTIEFVAKSLTNKLLMLDSYDITDRPKLEANCILVRSEKPFGEIQERVSDDYGLSDIIDGKCQTFVMSGDHKSFLDGNVEKMAWLIFNHLKDSNDQ